jgi:hypothetical protein
LIVATGILQLLIGLVLTSGGLSIETHVALKGESTLPIIKQHQHQRNKSTQGAPLVVLHVGPHKTGSTTLQKKLLNYEQELNQDGFFLPGAIPGLHSAYKSLANIAFSLQGYNRHTKAKTWPAFHAFLNRSNGHNIILSSEEFDRPSVNISRLASLLESRRVQVVIVYRRLYAWLFSWYFELHRYKLHRRWDVPRASLSRNRFDAFAEWLRLQLVEANDPTQFQHPLQAGAVLRRYQKHFGEVSIINFQAPLEDSTYVDFCCRILSVAAYHNTTCQRAVKENKSTPGANTGSSLEPSRILYAAQESGLVSFQTEQQIQNAKSSVGRRLDEWNNSNRLNKYQDCLEPYWIEALFQSSLQEEREIVPSWFQQANNGEAGLRSAFQSFRESKSPFCAVNTTKLFQNQEWQALLQKLGGNITS